MRDSTVKSAWMRARTTLLVVTSLASAFVAHGCAPASGPQAPGERGNANVFPAPEQMQLPEARKAPDATDAAAPTPPAGPRALPKAVPTPVVKAVNPIGRPEQIEALVVEFDQPMVTSPVPEVANLLRLKPATQGSARWLDDRHLEWRPTAPLPLGMRFEGEVVGAASALGVTLAGPRPFAFSTASFGARSDEQASLAYPAVLAREGALRIIFNHPVSPAAAAKHITIAAAASKSDLVGERVQAVPADLAVFDMKNGVDAAFDVRPATGVAVGHWYRVTIDRALTSPSGAPFEGSNAFVVRGREPLAVSEYYCGWPGCTATDTWTITFNSAIDAASVAGCLRVDPPVRYDAPSVDYNSISVRTSGLKIGKTYRITMTTGCKDTSGLALAAPSTHDFKIERPRAILRMPEGLGFMAPAAGDTPTAISLGAGWTGKLELQVRRIDHDQLVKLLPSASGYGEDLAFEELDAGPTATIVPPAASEERVVGIPLDLDPYLDADGRGLVFVRAATQHLSANEEIVTRTALVDVTDLSLVAKATPRETLVWITSMTNDGALGGVRVELFDSKGQLLWSGLTDDSGLARGPGATSPEDEKAPVFVVASLGGDLALLDLRAYATRFEAYRFGLPSDWSAHSAELAGIAFTERGVYKAGETVHVKSFVRVDRGGALEQLNGPVSVRVTDPMGDEIHEGEVKLGAVGDFSIDLPLASDAHLGTYAIEISILGQPGFARTSANSIAGPASGPEAVKGQLRGSFRVEAYRANTFEVKVEPIRVVAGPKPSTTPGPGGTALASRVTGRYLYGAPMAGAKAHWWLHRARSTFAPKGFGEFQFGTPSWMSSWWEPSETTTETLAEGDVLLDENGVADLAAAIEAKALGTDAVRLELEVEVTDVDEQRVAGRSSTEWHPADIIPGLRAQPDFGAANEPITVSVVAVDTAGSAVGKQEVELRWIRRSWTTTRENGAGGGWTWHSEPVEEVITTARATTSGADPVRVEFRATSAGTHIVEARTTDARGRVGVSRTEVWLYGDGARWRTDNDGTVQLVGEKKAHKVGDRARFVVQSPYASAHALVTVEKKGVLWQKTMTFEGTAPVFEVPITEDMRPNAFVSIVIEGTEPGADAASARTPSARVGYARLDIDNDDRRLTVGVTAERPRYRPGETVRARIAVQGANGTPTTGRVTFMAVDEGVLSLTGYKTPDPHAAVTVAKALAVVTNIARERAWSRLTADLDGEKSDWGGGGETGQATNYRSLFATTAAFMPDVELDARGMAEVEFKLPDNLTTFRLMAVAASPDGRFGSSDSRIEATKPLIVRPGLPRFLSVGDHFDARAVVQAVEQSVGGQVHVDVSVTGPVVIEGDVTQALTLDAGRAMPVTFKARAVAPGTAIFAFKARGGAGDPGDAVEVEVPVQWPAPARRAVSIQHLNADRAASEMEVRLPQTVRDDVGGLTVTLAPSELGQLVPGLRYLIDYPYGCVEQTTGTTLPLLVLRALDAGFTLPGIASADVLVKAQAGLDRLRTMQTASGGLGYWPGDAKPHAWGSVYGGFALVLGSRSPGLAVPQANLDRLLDYLRTILNGTAETNRDYWRAELDVVKPFAAYILALAGRPEASFHATLFEQRQKLPDFAKAFLALAIREAKGDPSQVTALVEDILANRTEAEGTMLLRRSDGSYYDSTMDSDARSTAIALMALLEAAPADPRVALLAQGLIGARGEGGTWGWDTQATAFATMALGRYFLTVDRPDGHDLATVKLGDEVIFSQEIQGKSLAPVEVHVPMATVRAANGKALTITKGSGLSNLHASVALDWVPRDIPRAAIDRGMRVTRRFETIGANGKATDLHGKLGDVRAGDLLRVQISVTSPVRRRYVAVDDLLPAGFEPVTLDFATTAALAGDAGREGDRYWSPFNHVEQRDDRVLMFADELPQGTSTTTYVVRATAAGSFLGPAARAHEMYHPEVFGQSDAVDVVVK